MKKLIDFGAYPVRTALSVLLQDKTTKKNIIWATDPPEALTGAVTDKSQITAGQLALVGGSAVQPRITKVSAAQYDRTRKKGEVFTPAWVCNLMNNYCDEEWFGRKDVFNVQKEHSWETNPAPVKFPAGKSWQSYVDSRRLEITCGEAPYLVSRYDAAAGEYILPADRIGLLDRKIRVVNENVSDEPEWSKWALRAFQSVYGYEYQGDNLLIARINLIMTFAEYYSERWGEAPRESDLIKAANVTAWNLWQMDGLKDTVPFGKPYEESRQLSIFDIFEPQKAKEQEAVPCKIYDWRRENSLLFAMLKKEGWKNEV